VEVANGRMGCPTLIVGSPLKSTFSPPIVTVCSKIGVETCKNMGFLRDETAIFSNANSAAPDEQNLARSLQIFARAKNILEPAKNF